MKTSLTDAIVKPLLAPLSRANLAFADRGPLPAGLYEEARKRLHRAAEQAAVQPGG